MGIGVLRRYGELADQFPAAINHRAYLDLSFNLPGFLSDRLQEALWREALHLVNDGVATPEELDAAISFGPGLRWALWGTCLIFHLAGGRGHAPNVRSFQPVVISIVAP